MKPRILPAIARTMKTAEMTEGFGSSPPVGYWLYAKKGVCCCVAGIRSGAAGVGFFLLTQGIIL